MATAAIAGAVELAEDATDTAAAAIRRSLLSVFEAAAKALKTLERRS
ncbi:MAG: hypothetical protein ACLQNE_35540 [Thermoguttaceae bacterium]